MYIRAVIFRGHKKVWRIVVNRSVSSTENISKYFIVNGSPLGYTEK